MPSARSCGRLYKESKEIRQKTPLHIRQAWKAQQEQQIRHAFDSARKRERRVPYSNSKRKENGFLARYLCVSLLHHRAMRRAEDYHAKSYNLGRQVLSLVDHLFVVYPVPFFLYRSLMSFDGLDLVFGTELERTGNERNPSESKYRDWFFAVAQGESFAKVSREVFTKREAHWFLQAPDANTIDQNILWARAAGAGLPVAGCGYLVERFDPTTLRRVGDRLPEMLAFYARAWDEMREYDRDEITDFIRAAVLQQEFSFKGRTFGSMRKLSHEWHRTAPARSFGKYQSWPAMLPLWEFGLKGTVVRAIELTSNRALNEEGAKQRHCVYTYTMRCVQGLSRIVSLRWFASRKSADAERETGRITLELSPPSRTIVQIRGCQNRRPTRDELEIVQRWAGDHGFRIHPYA